ncbi:MAG: ABC transporter permease subunit [Rubrobacteraceae bacterium]
MGRSFTAEFLKLRKRPATWVLALIFAFVLALFGYLFNYLFIVNAPEGDGAPPGFEEGMLEYLLPESVLVNVLSTGFAGFGGALVLILGALAVGSEYGWETFKVALTQKPGRLSLFFGKLVAVTVVLAVFSVLVVAVGAGISYAIAGLEDAAVEWPAAMEFLKGLGAGWLILFVFATFGVFLATLFRSTALAIGLGLVYLLVLENLFVGLAPQSETVEAIGTALPAKNALDLASSFGDLPQGFASPGEAVDASQAILVLVAYAAGFILLSALLFWRRDAT